jgi:hypothetical protein
MIHQVGNTEPPPHAPRSRRGPRISRAPLPSSSPHARYYPGRRTSGHPTSPLASASTFPYRRPSILQQVLHKPRAKHCKLRLWNSVRQHVLVIQALPNLAEVLAPRALGQGLPLVKA